MSIKDACQDVGEEKVGWNRPNVKGCLGFLY